MQRKDEFDVIHAHDWLTYYAGIAAKELTGKPLVIHVHATSFDRGSVDNIDTRVFAIEQKGMMMADRVVTVSNLTRNIVINRYGIDPGKVVTVHNAVDGKVVTVHNAVDFSGRENLVVERGVKEKVVTFLGRITYQKGPEYFIEAAAKVLKRTKNVRFVMAGSGDMMNRCIRHAARLGISDRFHFTGFLRGADVQKMRRAEDVRPLGRVHHAVHLRAVRHLAPRGHADRRPVHHLQAVRRRRNPEVRLQGGLLGRGRDG